MSAVSNVNAWIFDLDNTLYRGDIGFFSQIDKRMTEFISQYLDLPAPDARKVQKQYLADYGTSLSGLMAHHGMDPAEFLHYVHNIDLSTLKPSEELRAAIARLPGKKFIFTNGSRDHARNVGTHLGLYDLFDGVFAIEDVDYIPKPRREPFVKFCDHFDVDPTRAIMFEDSIKNLEVPKAMGMVTVLVSSGVDWFYDDAIAHPEKNNPGDAKRDWIDHTTNDLAAWLGDHT